VSFRRVCVTGAGLKRRLTIQRSPILESVFRAAKDAALDRFSDYHLNCVTSYWYQVGITPWRNF
jgi:hypothetical protein